MVKVAQEEIAATLAGDLDMHIEDLGEGGGVLPVEGYEPSAGCPVIDAALGADGNTFVVTTNTGQRFMVTVQEL